MEEPAFCSGKCEQSDTGKPRTELGFMRFKTQKLESVCGVEIKLKKLLEELEFSLEVVEEDGRRRRFVEGETESV